MNIYALVHMDTQVCFYLYLLQGRSERGIELPSTHDSREKTWDSGITRKPIDDLEHLKENSDVDAKEWIQISLAGGNEIFYMLFVCIDS